MRIVKIVIIAAVALPLLAWAVVFFAPEQVERSMNTVSPIDKSTVSEQAKQLHKKLFIADWHADSLLWQRDLLQKNDYGHWDFPRMREGNIALQVLTTVTKSPKDLNLHRNHADAVDNIQRLAVLQRWPQETYNSLFARAQYQANKLHELIARSKGKVVLIQSKNDLQQFIQNRVQQPEQLAVMLGTEGSHALDKDINNIDRLYDLGFRMMSLQHFFDNALGASLHGVNDTGLSEFGARALKKMQSRNIIVDVSHSSEKTVYDVLHIATKPVVVSHTGLYGHCPSKRNISEELMHQIVQDGGLIAIGFWPKAVCESNPQAIAQAIAYGVRTFGEDAIALGSDFDGAVQTPIDASGMAHITHHLLQQGLSHAQIAKVMGENTLRFLLQQLPNNTPDNT